MSVQIHGTGDSSLAFVALSTTGNAYSIPEQRVGVAKPKKEDVKQTDHVYWGESDDMPALLADMWKKNPDLLRAIQLKAGIMYASGITYRVENADGELENKRILEVEQLLERSFLYQQHVVNHIFQYFIAFPQLLLNTDRDKIVKIHPLVAPHCRFEHVNKDGFLYKLFLNAKWNEGATKGDPETKTFDLIDPKYYDPYTFTEVWDRKFSVVLPCAMATDDPYYPTPDYWTLKLSKWYEFAQKIPVFKDTIMKNQVSIKYLIEMPDWWMSETYKDWEDFDTTKRKKLMKEEVQKFEEFAAGFEKAGKSLTIIKKSEGPNARKYSEWNLKPVDDKMKDGMYVEDSLEATVKIFTAVGVDPGILGITPGKPGSSRSGSERREAYNLQQVVDQRVADVILRPFTYAAIFNGWTNAEQRIVFGFKKPHLQTLDKITAGARETTSTTTEN